MYDAPYQPPSPALLHERVNDSWWRGASRGRGSPTDEGTRRLEERPPALRPALATDYVAPKRPPAAVFRDDRLAYTDGKTDFIAQALRHDLS